MPATTVYHALDLPPDRRLLVIVSTDAQGVIQMREPVLPLSDPDKNGDVRPILVNITNALEPGQSVKNPLRFVVERPAMYVVYVTREDLTKLSDRTSFHLQQILVPHRTTLRKQIIYHVVNPDGTYLTPVREDSNIAILKQSLRIDVDMKRVASGRGFRHTSRKQQP
jgi:hypothetical protein